MKRINKNKNFWVIAYDVTDNLRRSRISKVIEKFGVRVNYSIFECMLTDKQFGQAIDIMTAKLLDDKRRRDFKVMVLPNLYGDIITDEAAELQGGVGTAGSANIGKRYAMFEAIHGSAPRMVQEGRAQYADPSSVLRAAVMLLEHIGEVALANKLDRALDICMFEEKKVVVNGRATGATAQEFTDYVLDTIKTL